MIRLAILLLSASSAIFGATTHGRERYQHQAQSYAGPCEIDVRLDLPGRNQPVILVEDDRGEWTLAEPTNRSKYSSYMNLKGKRLLLACPGQRNELKLGGSQAEATCASSSGANYFIINGRQHKIDTIECKERVSPYEYNTRQSCNGDGTILKLGYMVDNKIHETITTCHRLKDGMTYYSRHILDGNHLPQRGNGGKRHDEEGRPQFSFHNRDLFKGFPPYKFYKDNAQISALSNAIGSAEAQEIYNKHKDRFFAKGHLSPNADFLLETQRDITFLFVNVQPQWQEINGGNWNEVEIANRYNAAATGKKYEVITGTDGLLKPRSRGVELDYSSGKLPVPQSYTKLIREVESNKCIAFVSTNFPENARPEEKCTDICSDYDWPSLRDAKSAGYVYCCSYNEFAKAFPKAAPRVDCSGGVLSNKNRG